MKKDISRHARPRQVVTRRGFLAAGALGIGGLTLADLLRAEAAAGIRGSRKAVINVHLDGGPPQMDIIDLKPEAPLEIRGEFRPIDTKVPGIRICELLPRLASIADRIAFIRSLVGAAGEHNAFQCLSGFEEKELRSIGGRLALGCVLSKLWGRTDDYKDVFATLYHNLGIDPHATTISDPSGRPHHLLDRGQPVRELVG
jgi:hypothetical protein